MDPSLRKIACRELQGCLSHKVFSGHLFLKVRSFFLCNYQEGNQGCLGHLELKLALSRQFLNNSGPQNSPPVPRGKGQESPTIAPNIRRKMLFSVPNDQRNLRKAICVVGFPGSPGEGQGRKARGPRQRKGFPGTLPPQFPLSCVPWPSPWPSPGHPGNAPS